MYLEKTTNMLQVTDELDHIMLHFCTIEGKKTNKNKGFNIYFIQLNKLIILT
jgi:hypothetical protein